MSKVKIEERKIIPIAAMISAGKSKLLNVLFNIDFLECKAGIGTKFVNILRYNPNIQKPIFYHLIVEKENGKYVFYKDPHSEVKEGEKEIIEENKNINNILAASLTFKYEDIFYMTEVNQVQFIGDKNFLLSHDFCDIPGLSEYQGTPENKIQNEDKKEESKEKSKKDDDNIDEKFAKGMKQFGIVYKPKKPINLHTKVKKRINKEEILEAKNEEKKEDLEEDDIFYSVDVENEKTYLTEIFSILREYIDGAIIVLSVENYYYDENFVIITKLRKVIKKEINNFLIVLNKIDLSDNPKNDIDKCKGMFMQKFPKCKTFNINLNTFIALSAIQLQNELLMKTSFPHLLKFHFYNYLSKIKKDKNANTPNCNSFIDHLKEILKKVNIMDNQDIEKKLNELNSSENISEIESDFKNIIKEIKDNFKADELYLGITEEDFNKGKKETKGDDDEEFNFDVEETDDGNGKTKKDNNDISSFNACDIIKILYIFQKENKLIPPISEEAESILNYFKVKKAIPKKEPIIKKEVMSGNTKLNKEVIAALKEFCKEIKNFKIENEKYQYLTDEIIKIIEYLKTYDVIFIPFLGGSNAGKTTIINGIIGKDILPNDLNECTKRGIIIRYGDNDTISLRKANFKSEQFLDRTNYFFEAGHVICKGEEKVKDTLKGLNFGFNEKEEDSFYYIRTKIKLFDELGLDESLKKMIYLIDFPGYGTGNVFEQEIYNKAMSICNSFIFVVRNTVIKENAAKKVLDSIFNLAKEQKNKLTSQFIKSCLFVLNNDQNQETTQNELEKAKTDIQTVINGISSNDVNLCFFNAKYYLKFCDNFNYFSNIKKLIDYEYKNYNDNKSQIIKNPELSQVNIQKSFCEYFYKNLVNKVNLFDAKMKKSQQIIPEIDSDVTSKFNEINEKEKMQDLNKYEQKIKAILSFCKENINNMKILKESNINGFKDILYSQIKYFNDSMQKELKIKMNKIISDLDLFFKKDFKETKKDLKGVEQFVTNINKEKDKIQKLRDENKELILKIEVSFKDHIKDSLKSKKNLLDDQLQSKNYTQILQEINDEVRLSLKNLFAQITEFIKYNEKQTSEIYSISKNIIDSFSEGNNNFKISTNFEKYISKEIGDENKELDKELYEEITNSCESLSNIFMKKGFMDWFSSLFSSKTYLEKIIDIMIDTFMSKIGYVFKVLQKSAKNYLNELKRLIDQNVNLVTMKFNEDQLTKWKDLCASYEKTREIILKIQY